MRHRHPSSSSMARLNSKTTCDIFIALLTYNMRHRLPSSSLANTTFVTDTRHRHWRHTTCDTDTGHHHRRLDFIQKRHATMRDRHRDTSIWHIAGITDTYCARVDSSGIYCTCVEAVGTYCACVTTTDTYCACVDTSGIFCAWVDIVGTFCACVKHVHSAHEYKPWVPPAHV